MDKPSGLIYVILIPVAIGILIFFNKRQYTKDIVIKSNNIEYVIDAYKVRDNCVMFNYAGETITLCDNFEIIE